MPKFNGKESQPTNVNKKTKRPKVRTFGVGSGSKKQPFTETYSVLVGPRQPAADYSQSTLLDRQIFNPDNDQEALDRHLDEFLHGSSDNPEYSGFGLYKVDIGNVDLITAEEEQILGRILKEGIKAKEIILMINENQFAVPPSELVQLQELVQRGQEAVDILVEANKRLVISIAKKYVNRGVPFLDLIQEGNVGLIRAAHKFEAEFGRKFSTVATWWIRQAITRSILDISHPIRVPAYMASKESQLRHLIREAEENAEPKPTIDEICSLLDLSRDEAIQLFERIVHPVMSLETPISSNSNDSSDTNELGDFIDNGQPLIELLIENEVTRNELMFAVEKGAHLTPNEKQIIFWRYGIDPFPGAVSSEKSTTPTLQDVGNYVGLSHERIGDIQCAALRKLRRYFMVTKNELMLHDIDD